MAGRRRPQGQGAGLSTQRPAAGAALLVLAMAGFSLSDVLAKRLSSDIPPHALAFARYLALLATVLPLALARPRVWRSAQPALQVGRALGLVGSALLFLLALRALPVAEATAMVFASPLFVTLLAATVLRERIPALRWAPVLLGFAGVLIVVRPGELGYGGAEFLPLMSSACWASAVIFTRRLSARDAMGTTMLYSGTIGAASLALFLPATGLGGWRPHIWELLGMACTWCAAQWLTIAAYTTAAPGSIAPFSYSQLVWAALLGFAVFGHVPDGVSLAGMALIVASGLFAAWLSRRRVDASPRHGARVGRRIRIRSRG